MKNQNKKIDGLDETQITGMEEDDYIKYGNVLEFYDPTSPCFVTCIIY